MTLKNPTLEYASSDETQTPEGAARYYRELPTTGGLLWVALAGILFVILSTAVIYLRLAK